MGAEDHSAHYTDQSFLLASSMQKLTALCLLLIAFVAVNASAIPEDPVNAAEEVEEEDRDDIDDEAEYEEDRDDIDEEDDEEDINELIDENVEDRIKITDGCIRVGAKANGKHINTGSLRTDSARACQKLCEDLDGCEFFRWRDQDMKAKWRLRRRCYLLREKKDVKKRHNWSWGPKAC